MKSLIAKSILTTLFCCMTAHAGLYKGLDAEGNVVYSDKPFENAKAITPPAITVVDAPKVPVEEPEAETNTEEDKPVTTKYSHLSIISPKNDQVIWNEPALIVKANLKPALNSAEGHRTWLIMDGKPLIKNSRSLSLPIGRADRGSHNLQVQVRNKKGKILRRSKNIKVHIKNTVVPRKSPS